MNAMAFALTLLSTTAAIAQKPPAARALGPVERVSAEPLASVAAALPMPGGRVLVNDITGRRLVLLDSTLANPRVVADTTDATANAYGGQAGTLIHFRGDTALFIDPASVSMFAVGPAGQILRVMAVPRPGDARNLIGSIFGTPGIDAHGRLVYSTVGLGSGFLVLRGRSAPGRTISPMSQPDSAFIVRADLATRTIDTAATFKVPKVTFAINGDAEGVIRSTETTTSPLPLVDDWAVLPDGALAVVRGRDYHVDWLDADGRWTSSPKMPFDWQRIDDERKRAIIDSAVKATQDMIDAATAARVAAQANPATAGGGRGGGGGGRGGGRGGAGAPGGTMQNPVIFGRPELTDIPDYAPAFTRGSVHPDADGNLWILTTAEANGQPVYDVVSRRGELVDRVQLPPFRTIAGFAPGHVFMAVKDAAGVVHLERARIK
jgi:hypothetical protein